MYNLTKNQKIFLILFSILIIILLVYTLWNFYSDKNYEDYDELMINNSNNSTNISLDNNIISNIIEASSEKIVVYIIGCVQNPGIVELDIDSRVSDAVDLAGGLLEDADLSKINLAYKLEDGQKITIPSINDKSDEDSDYTDFISADPGNMISKSSTNNLNSTSITKVNINSANQTELETLPGIGPSIASKIIAYRNENGKFNSIDDIKNVSGIGDAKFENIKQYIII